MACWWGLRGTEAGETGGRTTGQSALDRNILKWLSLHGGGDGETGGIPDMNGASIILLQVPEKLEIFTEEGK